MSDKLQVQIADWPRQREILRAIREQVFVVEQSVPREIEWDGRDEEAVHVLGLLEGSPVACGRLLPNGKIGRMAVLARHRGQGIGRALLDALVAAASERGYQQVHLHAQQHASAFYQRAGFIPTGEPFTEAGIAHIAMRRVLREAEAERRSGGIAYPHPFDDCALALCAAARRELCILSPALDHRVFDSQAMADALSALARSYRHSRVRLLVADYRPLVQRGHRLLTLARRVPSSVHLQLLPEHPQWRGETLVIRDRSGVLYRTEDADKAVLYAPDSPASTAPHRELFEELWGCSAVHPEFRKLSL
ncbi:GNAT family N-acetyltransferase [Kineobactrum salinum]|uniref:GNAT family N-acetyltransferase n=1 Tax=Kineobactrum salinum TaxID=2708301 RepID=A0A6C0TWC0_9GAMM|nr:GNAT family N-acetyltransferase [Kineobactrum salinum]QIB64076.1 GNAT family N-acetyltransferase [Kineobactrum salinum]